MKRSRPLVKGFGVLNILDCKGLESHESSRVTVTTVSTKGREFLRGGVVVYKN